MRQQQTGSRPHCAETEQNSKQAKKIEIAFWKIMKKNEMNATHSFLFGVHKPKKEITKIEEKTKIHGQ